MANNNDYDAIVKVSTLTKWMIILGLLGLLPLHFYTGENLIVKSVFQIIEVVGSALFSAGLVSVIVEISTIRNLVSDAFNKMISGNFPIETLSYKALKNLNRKTAAALTNVSVGKIDNTVYRYEDKLLELVNSKYYDYHKITYHITPDEKNECIHIKTKISYKIINKNQVENFFEVRLKLYKLAKDITIEECIKKLKVKKILINNKQISLSDIIRSEPVDHNTESTYYDYKIQLYKELTGIQNTIEAEFCYDVPIHDICQSFKISSPCKYLEHKFYIEPDAQTGEQWVIKANAYSTFFHRQNEEGSNYSVDQNIDTSLIIRYTDWALVGNGYCVFYQKK